jgi:glycosyltransferase involved in cell wall biosynthesis
LAKLLFVYNNQASFIRLDIEELRKGYEVTECYLGSRRFNPIRIWSQVQAHDLVFGWFASWHTYLPIHFAKLLGKPSILIVGGYDLANIPEIGYGHQRGGLKKAISRRTMAAASCLVTNSYYTQEEAERNASIPKQRVQPVYHGVPDPHGSLPPTVRSRMVLTVGNVDRGNLWRKGHEAFVRAAALATDINFVLIGAWKDGAVDYLRSIATQNVTFTGRLSDAALFDYYCKASIYVQPSLHEGFGLSVAEAMLAGCIPVTTRAGSLPEVVGDCGVYIENQEAGEMAKRIREALTLPDSLRNRARQRILDCFPLKRRQLSFDAIIDGLLHHQANVETMIAKA